MATLASTAIKDTYPLLLKIDSTGVDSTLRKVEDGDGTDSSLSISDDSIAIDAGDKFGFDGTDTGTYITESSDDVLDIYVGGANMMKFTESSTDTVTITGNLTVGVDDTGHDVKFFGATSGCFMMYDQSENELVIERGDAGAGNKTAIKLDTDSAATGDSLSIDWNLSGDDLTTSPSCQIKGIRAGSAARGDLAFLTRNSSSNLIEAMRIDENQRLGIGDTEPSYKLDVKIPDGNNNTLVARFQNADASDPNGIYIHHSGIDLSSDDSADHSYINCSDSNNTPFVVYGDGDVANEDNSYTSDIRIKKDIADATSKLEDLLKLKVRNYKFKKSDGGDVAGKLGGKRIGFIADELEEVFPSLIVKRKTTKFGVEYDDLKSIRVSALMPILVKAVQELSASNDALKKRIEALEAA